MKVLQVNNVYGEKSTGKLTAQLHQGLRASGHESVVVYGRGTTAREPGVIRLCPEWYGKVNALASRITGLPYGGCLLSTWRLKRIIRREKPDVVHLQCINGNFVNIYRLVGWLKKRGIKTLSSQHAEFMYTAGCGYAFECDQWKHGCTRCPNPKKATKSLFFDGTARSWRKMRKAFQGFEKDCVICPVSPWTQSRVEQADILKDIPCVTVLNGVDTQTVFRGGEEARQPVVLHVTSQFSLEPGHIKGGRYLAELARRLPQVRFRVAGDARGCGGLPGNVELLGVVYDQQTLAEEYRQASIMVLVSKKETFSMPCAESLCCGTPVVGFRAGAPEQISLPEYSCFVDYGDLDALEAQVRRWLSRTDLNRAQIARHAHAAYSLETMVNSFLEVYEKWLMNSKN